MARVTGEKSENGTAPEGVLEAVNKALAEMPDTKVPVRIVAELVSLGLQTELGDNLWRGFCLGRGFPEPMRLGIESADAVAGVVPNAPRGT